MGILKDLYFQCSSPLTCNNSKTTWIAACMMKLVKGYKVCHERLLKNISSSGTLLLELTKAT